MATFFRVFHCFDCVDTETEDLDIGCGISEWKASYIIDEDALLTVADFESEADAKAYVEKHSNPHVYANVTITDNNGKRWWQDEIPQTALYRGKLLYKKYSTESEYFEGLVKHVDFDINSHYKYYEHQEYWTFNVDNIAKFKECGVYIELVR